MNHSSIVVDNGCSGGSTVTVNANSVVRSSFMLVGVGCEGKLRFVMKGIASSFICGACNFSIFALFSEIFDARFILQAFCEIGWEFSVILNS